jgi:hypothetical protein
MSSGYDFDVNDAKTFVLKPSFLMRYVTGAPMTFDVNALLTMHKYVEIGGTYRTDNAQTREGLFPMNTVAGMVNLHITKNITVGFVYETSTREELASSRNTNEFLLRYKF